MGTNNIKYPINGFTKLQVRKLEHIFPLLLTLLSSIPVLIVHNNLPSVLNDIYSIDLTYWKW